MEPTTRIIPQTGGPEPSFDEERKLVTVLFADVAGFVGLAEALDPEPLRDLLNALFERLVPCVERFGGTVDKFIGDCMMALFGAPVAHDDDAARAILAALELGAALRSFAEERRLDLALHVGINTGRVVTGWVGSGSNRQYSAIGDAVNVASRLQEASAPGEILIGPDTHRLAGWMFHHEAAGSVTVRGRSGPVAAVRITGDRRALEWGGRQRRIASSLVGRERELAVFVGTLDRLRLGRGGVLFVSAEAGLGKSRLVAEVRRAASRGLTWLEGRAMPFGQTLSYWPLQEIIRADAGILASDPLEERRDKLARRLRDVLGGPATDVLPCLANLLGLAESVENSALQSSESKAAEVGARCVQYFTGLARQRPLVLVFEDVHWLDASSTRLIERLMPLTTKVPMLLCLVARADPASTAGETLTCAGRDKGLLCEEIVLGPLPPAGTRQLLSNLLGRDDLPEALEQTIQRKAEGNPFFVEEIVRHLVDAGVLAFAGDSGWQMTTRALETVVPDTLEGVIAARVDRLPSEAKLCLRLASVVGRRFSHDVLRRLTDNRSVDLDLSLRRLEELQLIHRSTETAEAEYAFKHSLVQEVTYESLLHRQRKEYHAEVARAIAGVYPERLEDYYGLLAFHHTKAENWGPAQDLLIKAGERSATMAAETEAVEHYKRAMAVLVQAFSDTGGVPEVGDPVEWFAQRTEPFWHARRLGDLQESVQVFYDKVLEVCGPADQRTLTAACILAAAHVGTNQHLRAAALLESTLEICRKTRPANNRCMTRALFLLGLVRLNRDELIEAEGLLRQALQLELCRPDHDEALLQEIYVYLSSAYAFMGRAEESTRIILDALARPQIKGTAREWLLLLNLSSNLVLFGHWDEARGRARHCLEQATGPYHQAEARRHLAAVYHAEGAYDEARQNLKDACRMFESIGRANEVGQTLKDLAETELSLGEIQAAEHSASRALELMAPVHGEGHFSGAYWTLAGVALARGELDKAEDLLAHSLHGRNPFVFEMFFRRALLRLHQGRISEAQADYDRATDILRALGGPDHPRIRAMESSWAGYSNSSDSSVV